MSQKRRHGDEAELGAPSAVATDAIEGPLAVSRSSPIKDRASLFVAVFSPAARATSLQEMPEFHSATHRVAAWRRLSSQRSLTPSRPLYETGHDDDGEQYAGKRLEKLLVRLNVSGAVVVARWYGGTLLGPVRFDHIESCARDAIQRWRTAETGSDGRNKRPRLGAAGMAAAEEPTGSKATLDEARKRLTETLTQRDESIFALRSLLASKRTSSAEKSAAVPPPKKLRYDGYDIEVLERLETARDRTISWLLSEIDKVETAMASATAVGDAERSPRAEVSVKPSNIDPGEDGSVETSDHQPNSPGSRLSQ